jgi:hypothetical protein
MTRTELITRANAVGRESWLRGAVLLSHDSDAYAVARWLQWCDPNGEHLVREITWGADEEVIYGERCSTYTDEEAWEALERMLDQ